MQKFIPIAMDYCAAGEHFRIEQGTSTDQPREVALAGRSPGHHGGNREATIQYGRGFGGVNHRIHAIYYRTRITYKKFRSGVSCYVAWRRELHKLWCREDIYRAR